MSKFSVMLLLHVSYIASLARNHCFTEEVVNLCLVVKSVPSPYSVIGLLFWVHTVLPQ